jgi:chitinase
MEQLFEKAATVLFKATAKDADGSITKVEFLDNGKTVSVGSTSDYKTFSFSSDQLANGFHVLTAVATDNGGRSTESGAKQVFVNGPIKVRILKSKTEDSLAAGSDLILTAVATNPLGSIEKIEFFYNGGFPLGEAVATGDNRYSIKLRNLAKTNYSIEAVATDQAGFVSKSATLRFNVMK